jgi:hypothetical protein
MKTIGTLKKLAAFALIINFCTANAWIYTIKNDLDEPIRAYADQSLCPGATNAVTLPAHTEGTIKTDGGCCSSYIKFGSDLRAEQIIYLGLACYPLTIHIKYTDDGKSLTYKIE